MGQQHIAEAVEVDVGVLDDLHVDVGGDTPIIVDLVASYRTRASEIVADLVTAAAAHDVAAAKRLAHDLKSISGLVGATGIGRLASSIELEDLRPADVAERVREIHSRLPAVHETLAAHLGRL